jgi:hypothetical protein
MTRIRIDDLGFMSFDHNGEWPKADGELGKALERLAFMESNMIAYFKLPDELLESESGTSDQVLEHYRFLHKLKSSVKTDQNESDQ